MSRPIRRLLVFHNLKVAIDTKSEEYPIVLVQDSYSPHIRIPRFVDHRLSNNPLVWSSYDASHPRWSQLHSKSPRAPTLTLLIVSQLHACCSLVFPTKEPFKMLCILNITTAQISNKLYFSVIMPQDKTHTTIGRQQTIPRSNNFPHDIPPEPPLCFMYLIHHTKSTFSKLVVRMKVTSCNS